MSLKSTPFGGKALLFCALGMIIMAQRAHSFQSLSSCAQKTSSAFSLYRTYPASRAPQKYTKSITGCSASTDSEMTTSYPFLGKVVARLQQITASQNYALLQGAIVFGLLSAVDGGFSGDWSRYGLISLSTEEAIKAAFLPLGVFHIACSAGSALVTSSRGQPVLPAVLKTMLVGGLAFGQVLFQTKETQIEFPKVSDIVDKISTASQVGWAAEGKKALASAIAGKYDMEAVNAEIDLLLKTEPCVMFSFTTCPYCIKAKETLIDELGAKVKVVELDVNRSIGFPIRAELGKRTGRTSVPSVWIGGQFIGGCNDGPKTVKGVDRTLSKGGIAELNDLGELRGLLTKAGALSKGRKTGGGIPFVKFTSLFK